MEKLEPRIRFGGFGGSWERNILGDIATFSKGRGYCKKDLVEVGNPIILYGRLYTNYQTVINNINTYSNLRKNSILSEGGEVIVPSSGETPEDISIASTIKHSNVIIAGDLNIIKTDKLDSTFLALSLSNGKVKKELTNCAEGATITHLKNKDIKKVRLYSPTMNEQEKIGSLFEKFDSLIEKQEKYLDLNKKLKDSLLQKAFPKKDENIPEIRICDFNTPWEKNSLSKILREHIEKTETNNQHDILSSTNNGLFRQKDYFKNQVASDNNIGYKIIKLNQLVLSPQNLWMGNINFNTKYDIGIVSPSYKIFNINFHKFNLNFINEILKTKRMFYNYKISSEQGASVVRRNLNLKDFLNIKTKIPSFKEQEKIGNLFKSLDEKIEKEEKKLNLYKSLKKALLQKMFI